MVGNGLTTYEYDTLDNRIDMAFWFGLIDTRLWELMKVDGCSLVKSGAEQPASCNKLLAEFLEYTQNINLFDIFKTCI